MSSVSTTHRHADDYAVSRGSRASTQLETALCTGHVAVAVAFRSLSHSRPAVMTHAYRDWLCEAAPDDVDREVVYPGCKPAEHERDKQHSTQRVAAGVSGHFGSFHEDVIDVMDQKHHTAHSHETASQERKEKSAPLSVMTGSSARLHHKHLC